jgi:inhibitor of KinA sporulation pathway (predicted exonuclease)
MRYVIVDLEATSWEKGTNPDRMEIIEIGAALLDSSTGPGDGGIEVYQVQPKKRPDEHSCEEN